MIPLWFVLMMLGIVAVLFIAGWLAIAMGE